MSQTRGEILKAHGLPLQSYAEEAANAAIHFIGLVLSIIGLCLLVIKANAYGTVWHVVSCSIFGSSLILLYLTSTLYHSFPWVKIKRVLRRMDHIGIYLLIAGSYTPITLTFLRPSSGWIIFGLVWGMAFTGSALKAVYGPRFEVLSNLGYILMGWLIVIAYNPMMNEFPRDGLLLFFAGGLCYTLGVIFYALDKRVKFFHALWHVAVLAGSIFHFFAVFNYVIPMAK
jgi:hemolysin III